MAPTEIVWFVFSVASFAAVGSFCCVVIDRWPAAASVMLGGQSRCSSCHEPIRRRDNIPVVSWLALRGRCRRCRSGIPGYHPVVELAVPAMWVVSVAALGWHAELWVVAWSVPVGLTVAMVLAHGHGDVGRVLGVATAIAFGLAAGITAWRGDPDPVLGWCIGAVSMGGPLAGARLLRAEGFTAGDAMLAVFLGGAVGTVAATDSLVAAAALAMVGLTVAALVAVAHAGYRRKSSDAISFAPSLAIGACVAIVGAATISL